MNQVLSITREQVAETVDHLQIRSAGAREAVVLWLAQRTVTACIVRIVLLPLQEAGVDFFSIPPEGIRDVLTQCRLTGLFVAAQLHTHPLEAFHSEADDDLALIRHRNALSFVFPNFAATATSVAFSRAAKLYRLSANNSWEFVPENQHFRYYQIQ